MLKFPLVNFVALPRTPHRLTAVHARAVFGGDVRSALRDVLLSTLQHTANPQEVKPCGTKR